MVCVVGCVVISVLDGALNLSVHYPVDDVFLNGEVTVFFQGNVITNSAVEQLENI